MQTKHTQVLSDSQTQSVTGGRSIPTQERLDLYSSKSGFLTPIEATPVEPKDPVFITQALYEDGGHWIHL